MFTITIEVGDFVQADEVVAVIETDKVNVDIRSTYSGVIKKFYANEGDTVAVDAEFFEIDTEGKTSAAASSSQQPQKEAEPKKVES
jgi:2-oxoglutarate dehydrogenase E2 component (dihydrolipoamide succinyltransferase)